MENLSAEIVIYIASYLSLSDKLECIRVTKAWNIFITSTNLYENITLSGNTKLRKAINFFNKSNIGKTVRYLTINQMEENVTTLALLPTLFPYVKLLDWTEKFSRIDQIISGLVEWKHLERLFYCPKFDKNMPFFFHFFTFTNLKYLQIDLRYTGEKRYILSRSIINHLFQVPLLEQIVLIKLLISISDLDKLHRQLPCLRYICLIESEIDLEQVEPFIVQYPANQLELFHLCFRKLYRVSSAKYQISLKKWLTYIGEKYKNLQYLQINGHGKSLHPSTIRKILQNANLINKSNIKHYSIQL